MTAAAGPVLVAVYSRGRAIPLYAGGLDDMVIEDLVWFLCGACSCQVKALNPGTDLLFGIDWEEAVWNHPHPTPMIIPDGTGSPITPVVGRPDWQPAAASATVDTAPPPPAESDAPPATSQLLVGILVLVGLGFAVWLLLLRQPKP